MSDTWVVMWRHGRRSRWQVQPYVHSGQSGEHVARKMVGQYGGEALVLPIVIPPAEGEDARDLEEET